jgi:hypothetical protein
MTVKHLARRCGAASSLVALLLPLTRHSKSNYRVGSVLASVRKLESTKTRRVPPRGSPMIFLAADAASILRSVNLAV